MEFAETALSSSRGREEATILLPSAVASEFSEQTANVLSLKDFGSQPYSFSLSRVTHSYPF